MAANAPFLMLSYPIGVGSFHNVAFGKRLAHLPSQYAFPQQHTQQILDPKLCGVMRRIASTISGKKEFSKLEAGIVPFLPVFADLRPFCFCVFLVE